MNEMNKKYLNMSAVELAQDHDFLRWRLMNDATSEEFWLEYLLMHPEKSEAVAEAIRIVGTARMNRERLTKEELRTEQRRLIAAVRRSRLRRRVLRFTTAACIAAMIGAGVLMLQKRDEGPSAQLAELMTGAATDKVQLVTVGGGVVEIGDGTVESDADGTIWTTEEGERTLVAAEMETSETVTMNKLIVPGGKRSSIALPDGSMVWVNAGSTVEFPSRFGRESREVRVEGEVYVEAVHDPDRPFLLHTGDITVRVLGTKFNVSAYGDQARRTVVLVDGSVDVLLPTGSPILLLPNDMLVIENHTARTEIVDARQFITWRDGILNFDGQSLRSILASVSRYYGVELQCEGIDGITLSGKLFLFSDMETTLNNITAIAPVAWHVEDGKIIIEKR